MKRYIAILLLVSVFAVLIFAGLTVPTADAAVSVTASLFEVEVKDINKISNTNTTRFNFETTNIKNRSSIGHFKIRVWCEKGITVGVNNINDNSCGKAVTLDNQTADTFSLFLKNDTLKTIGFSFKLKAYDKNGKWLYSEKESFKWK